MIDRRSMLMGGATAAVCGALPGLSLAGEPQTLRIASLKFGSLSWLLETVKAEGLDAKAGLKLDVFEVASNQAGPIALISGDCDIMVSDWPWAMRQRSTGEAVRFSPFSSSLGAVMVPKDSKVTSLADLAGKKIGVAGSAIDKSWLVLRAYSKKTTGKDIAEAATPVFGAPPLLTEEIKAGRLDAVLNFWPYAARLKGAGYRPLLSVSDMMKELGLSPVPPLVGFIWKEKSEAAKGDAITSFLAAARMGNGVLASSDAAWERIKPLTKAADDAEFAALKEYYRAGIPGPWRAEETASAEKLMKLLVESGDKDLVGDGTRFDAKLFRTAG